MSNSSSKNQPCTLYIPPHFSNTEQSLYLEQLYLYHDRFCQIGIVFLSEMELLKIIETYKLDLSQIAPAGIRIGSTRAYDSDMSLAASNS